MILLPHPPSQGIPSLRRNQVDFRAVFDFHKIVPGSALDLNTPQTPGLTRAAAITPARTGASKLWGGHRDDSSQRQDRRASPRRARARDFRRQRPRAHALGECP